MKNIIIKPLSSELTADYLDFFDNRAFTDDNPNGPCYCTSPNQEESEIQQMVRELHQRLQKESVMMQGRTDILLLRDMRQFQTNETTLIIKVRITCIRKPDLLKPQKKTDKLS